MNYVSALRFNTGVIRKEKIHVLFMSHIPCGIRYAIRGFKLIKQKFFSYTSQVNIFINLLFYFDLSL